MRAERAAACLTLLAGLVASAGELTVTAAPQRLQLGTDSVAQIVIAGPEDLSSVRVSVNHGTVGPARQTAPGRFVADYKVPGHTYPRVAIIAVVGSSKGVQLQGWTRLPLWGSALALLRSAPNRTVSLRIGERTYDALRLDARGIGRFQVMVPPGINTGSYGAQVLDLALPRVALTHLVPEHHQLPADREQTVTVRLYSVTESGLPRRGAQLQARVTHGSVTDFRAEAEGVYSARWTIPASTPGDAELSAWSSQDSSMITTAQLRLLSGPAAKLALTADPARVRAGDTREVKLTVAITDVKGNPAAEIPTFSTTLGTIGWAEPAGAGLWTTTLRLPRGFGGSPSVVVAAVAAEAPPARVSIPLEPGPARDIQVAPAQLSVVGDGSQSSELAVELLDADRNRVEGTLSATASAGQLTALAADPEKGARYQYQPPRALGREQSELVFSHEGLSVRVPVEVQPAPSRLTVGPKIGLLSNFGKANAFAVSGELAFWPTEHFGLGLEPGYVYVSRTSLVSSGNLSGSQASTQAHGVPLMATVSWRARIAGAFRFCATGAGGIMPITSTITLKDQQPIAERSVLGTAQLAAGVSYSLGRLAPFVEVGLRWMSDAPNNQLSGNVFSLGVAAGCRLDVL